MARLGLSSMGKLPGQMGDWRIILSKVQLQPEVHFTADGCVMVMKSDDTKI